MRHWLTALALVLLPLAAVAQTANEPAPFTSPPRAGETAPDRQVRTPSRRVIPKPLGGEAGLQPAPAPEGGTSSAPQSGGEARQQQADTTEETSSPLPIVELELEAENIVPGQSTRLRLTVLVPTYMPKPPVLPGYDLPNLMVRLPEKSTLPISRRVGGETWSGIQRSYAISPLAPGAIDLPAQTVTVTYADPANNQPLTVEQMTEGLTLTGVVPEGAEGLDPFIAAEGIELAQQIDGEATNIDPGSAVTRRIVATVEGTTPLLVPPLVPGGGQIGLAAYAKEPVVDLKADRGVFSGSRTEEVTYMAEGGGRFSLPPVELLWFNLGSGEIETASVEGVEITVNGPPAGGGEAARDRAGLRPLLIGLGLAALVGLLLWRLWPPFRRWQVRRREAYAASEDYAYRRARRLIGAEDYDAAVKAIGLWWSRLAPQGESLPEALSAALLDIGRDRFGAADTRTGSWQTVKREIEQARKARKTSDYGNHARLDPLNPVPRSAVA
ncbi:BatD family protein [Rhodobacteraceae bacterium NNCM2]|nr:BatD family protein [Coraliihabitans acroporae]